MALRTPGARNSTATGQSRLVLQASRPAPGWTPELPSKKCKDGHVNSEGFLAHLMVPSAVLALAVGARPWFCCRVEDACARAAYTGSGVQILLLAPPPLRVVIIRHPACAGSHLSRAQRL